MSFVKELNSVFTWLFVFGRFPFRFDPHTNQIIATKSTIIYTAISQLVYLMLSVNLFCYLLYGYGMTHYKSMTKKSYICVSYVFLWTTYAAVSTLIIINRQEKMKILNRINSWHISAKIKKQFYMVLFVLSIYYIIASMSFALDYYPPIMVIYGFITESARSLIILFVIYILLITKLIGVRIAINNSELQLLCAARKFDPLNVTKVLLSFDDIFNIRAGFCRTIGAQMLLILTNEFVYMSIIMCGVVTHFVQHKPMRRLFLVIHLVPHLFFLLLIFHTMDKFGGQVCVRLGIAPYISKFQIN